MREAMCEHVFPLVDAPDREVRLKVGARARHGECVGIHRVSNLQDVLQTIRKVLAISHHQHAMQSMPSKCRLA
jgi:hypothetical protein